jgi:hypothetical protein
MSLLYFLQVPGSIDDSVEDDPIAAEQALYIGFGTERGCIDPHLEAHAPEGPDQVRRPKAQAFFI